MRPNCASCRAWPQALPHRRGRHAAGRAHARRSRAETWAEEHGLPFVGALRETRGYVRCAEQGLTMFDLPAARAALRPRPVAAHPRLTAVGAGAPRRSAAGVPDEAEPAARAATARRESVRRRFSPSTAQVPLDVLEGRASAAAGWRVWRRGSVTPRHDAGPCAEPERRLQVQNLGPPTGPERRTPCAAQPPRLTLIALAALAHRAGAGPRPRRPLVGQGEHRHPACRWYVGPGLLRSRLLRLRCVAGLSGAGGAVAPPVA